MNDELMRCGTCVEPGRFELTQRPRPETAAPGQVLVDIQAVGLCGTDYHILQGKHPYLEYPRVIGHELSGRVAEGSDRFAKGELVVVNPYLSCGECRACQRGKSNCCEHISVLGVHGDGGMCARTAVPEGNLYSADGLTPIQAAMVEFLAIGAHAVSRSGAQTGDRVLITGAGPIGIGTALFARLAGAEVHMMDVSAQRLDMVRQRFGFERVHRSGSPLMEGNLGSGFDAVFDATGNVAAIEAGFQYLAHGSSYVLVSVVKNDIRFSDPEFHKREARIIGSRNALDADFRQVMAAIRTGQIDCDALCSEVIALADLPARFASLAQNRDALIKVIVTDLI
ncbi:zinc-binding alcohol dehydrogenase family protein [Paracoccus sp. Z330]|uniref:Zinc-binding alcohol dehydrogenase family protein n=1 Tax=Paracoccus onchidii TaxID=3017813 RepID=A0ABT4ZAB2_9RHOB|nr:zinc-binding alcohol dehydrogenase family protein [Paracoccus onchidii]MDB6176291.1 zinc-binding alcohol dehydrogenase family protein [Paracoccus onchidii]